MAAKVTLYHGVMVMLCFLMITCIQSLKCQIGTAVNKNHQWQWTLTHPNKCECTSIGFGGLTIDTAHTKDGIGEISKYFDLDCDHDVGEKATTDSADISSSDKPDASPMISSVDKMTSVSTESSGHQGSSVWTGSGSGNADGSITITSSNTVSRNSSSKLTTDIVSTMPHSTSHSGTTRDNASTIEPSTRKSTTLKTRTVAMTTAKVCINYRDKLGMQDGDIPNANIQASNYYDPRTPQSARLNGPGTWGSLANGPQWIQADIGYETFVFAVITQGDGEDDDWVTSFKVSTFLLTDLSDETFVMNPNGTVKLFPGNTEPFVEVTAAFPQLVKARVVRITCLAHAHDRYQMRFEVLGCKH